MVLIGNAAQALHPVAGQGFNLGLRDAATLAEMLAKAEPGADFSPMVGELLGKFAAWRAEDRSGVTRFTDSLVKLFGSHAPGVSTGAQFRSAAVRPESRGQARAVARELGLRRAHAAPGARPATRMNIDYDVAVVGAGPIGLATAVLLARQAGFAPARVAVFDRRIPDSLDRVRELPVDLRVFALSRASEKILRAADAWADVAATRSEPYERMQVWHADVPPHGGDALVFDAAEIGERDLGVIVGEQCIAGSAGRRRAPRGRAARGRRCDRARTGS